MCILDGNAYDAKCLEAGQERDEDLDACSLLVNNKTQPLLSPSGAATHNSFSKVIVQLTVGFSMSVIFPCEHRWLQCNQTTTPHQIGICKG